MNLSFLQYNLHLFKDTVPGEAPLISSKVFYQDGKRLGAFLKKLQDDNFDLVLLEEIWSNGVKEEIIKEMTQSYFFSTWDGNEKPMSMGSGLLVLSKRPIRYNFSDDSQELKLFTAFNSKIGMDSLSNKGFLTIEVDARSRNSFWLIHTHTQAGYSEKETKCRYDNMSQIYKHISLLKKIKNQPIIVVGDLNIVETTLDKPSEYKDMHEAFSSLGLKNSFRKANISILKYPGYTYNGKKNKLIKKFAPEDVDLSFCLDYVFYTDSRIEPVEAFVPDDYLYKDIEMNTNMDISDHYPLVVKLSFLT